MVSAFEQAIGAVGNSVYTLSSLTASAPHTELDAGFRLGRASALAHQLKDQCRKLELVALTDLAAAIAAKDAAYTERDQLVAFIAHLLQSLGYTVGLGKHDPADTDWEDDWRNIIYMDLPSGQVSWHIHDTELELFAGLPPYERSWDGSDTPEKYRRLLNSGIQTVQAVSLPRSEDTGLSP